MANQLILGRALDANGYIAGAATATVYADGTSTLITVYSDVDGATPAANPITADANGQWPQRYVTEDAKVVVKDSDGVTLYTLDPAPVSQGTGSAASAISFAPTVDLPQTNVQDAIEAAGDLAIAGVADFGIGVTGNAVLLASVDATNIAAGVYRFDGTTTGTLPTGVAAADTGLIEHWRQTSATAMQFLFHATTDRVFHRRMAASTWGTWREVITSNQAPAEGDILYRTTSAWARLAKGTAGQVLRMNSGATAPEWGAGFGTGQSWQDMTASRAFGTSYQNTTGTAIEFNPRATWAGGSVHMSMETSPDNSTWTVVYKVNHNIGSNFTDYSIGSLVVPDTFYYRCRLVAGTVTLTTWMELRA